MTIKYPGSKLQYFMIRVLSVLLTSFPQKIALQLENKRFGPNDCFQVNKFTAKRIYVRDKFIDILFGSHVSWEICVWQYNGENLEVN